MELKPNITFDTFLSLDIRVCRVLEAERVPKTDKLLKFVIDTGVDTRECVTNLGGEFEPEKFVGYKFPFIINLESTTIKKIESKAMIFVLHSNQLFDICNDFNVGDQVYTK